MTHSETAQTGGRLVLVTGPSGAGRSTAIKVFEALGFEVIDNLPLSMMDRLLQGSWPGRDLALGIDVRNRDFSTDAVVGLLDDLAGGPEIAAELLFLDCRAEVLVRRYSETRHVHPLAPEESADVGIARELDLLVPVRERADVLIDTSELTPHDLKSEIERIFDLDADRRLAISVESFSYKRGLPRGVDMVFDMRFLANPHWEPSLRGKTGLSGDVAAFVTADPRYGDAFERIFGLVESLIPAYKDEGKSYLSVAFGCTGGQHRSVAVAESLARALADKGWQVSTRHRELERRTGVSRPTEMG